MIQFFIFMMGMVCLEVFSFDKQCSGGAKYSEFQSLPPSTRPRTQAQPQLRAAAEPNGKVELLILEDSQNKGCQPCMMELYFRCNPPVFINRGKNEKGYSLKNLRVKMSVSQEKGTENKLLNSIRYFLSFYVLKKDFEKSKLNTREGIGESVHESNSLDCTRIVDALRKTFPELQHYDMSVLDPYPRTLDREGRELQARILERAASQKIRTPPGEGSEKPDSGKENEDLYLPSDTDTNSERKNP